MYSTRHIARIFGVSRETVRKWGAEFARHLSSGANPGEGRTRQFNDDDMRVFALIATGKNDGLLYDDIHAMLDSGQRADIPDNPQQLLNVQDNRQVQVLKEQLTQLRQVLREAEDARQQAEGGAAELRKQVEKLQGEVARLSREIGRLEAKLDE